MNIGTRKNPTSALKKGISYQELWFIKICGDWLLNPDLYDWLHLEFIPEEIEHKSFYLDDFVALTTGNKYNLYQTKHKQNPNDAWTWDELLKPLSKRKTSLLKKWSGSLFKPEANSVGDFYSKTEDAFFITNGNASDAVAKYLNNELIDIELLKNTEPELYKAIVKEVGNDKKTDLFFKKFKFKFSQKSKEDFEEDVRKFFYETLHVTKAGFNNFQAWVQNRDQDQETINILYDDIRKECEFDNPQVLNEKFIIPDDFEFFDEKVHDNVLEDLKKKEGGIKVIYGEPGAGKSVYLSKLDSQLNDLNIICIKHHYHISPEDTNPLERLNAERVIEAIKAQFKSHSKELDELANVNSKGLSLEKFVSKIAEKSVIENKSFVIIIDGLDHPLRYGAKEELEALLNEICQPQKGVWIILGMQLVAKSFLPPVVNERCPEGEWIKIKGLSKQSVLNVLDKNLISLKLPTEDQQKQALLDKIYDITQGNPLHLRYTLQQLRNLNGNALITDYSCQDLIPYNGDIEKYYDSIWGQISDIAKTLLLTIASVNFLFTEQQLIECISQTISNPSDVTNGFKLIAHLVKLNYRNELSVYHNSFEVYLRSRPEYEQQKIVLRRNIKNWLSSSGNLYLKWAELRLIEHDLGNSVPLMEIDRVWLLEAIAHSSNPSQIESQLEKASNVAVEKKDFPKALKISYLHNYYINLNISSEEARELIWLESFFQNQDLFGYLNINELPSSTLPTLAQIAEMQGEIKSIKAIIKELTRRLDSQEYRQGSIPSATRALIEVIPFDRDHKVKRVYEYIIKFRDMEVSHSLFRIYSSSLLALNQISNLNELLGFSLTDDEKQAILNECSKYGLTNPSEDLSKLFKDELNLSLISLMYVRLKGISGQELPDLPKYEVFPLTLKEYDTGERAEWRDFYSDNFLNGILYVIDGRSKEIESWISQAPDSWAINAMKALFKASLQVGSTIPQSSINYSDVFNQLEEIEELKWPEDRDSLSIQHAFSDSLKLIFNTLLRLKIYFKNKVSISSEEYELIIKRPYLFNKPTLQDIALNSDTLIFEQEVYLKIRDENIKRLEDSINYFPERATDFANTAKLTRLYENIESASPLLIKAVDNLLGHGYHKDMYFFDLIDAVGFCAEAGIAKEKISNWINRIIPLVEFIGSYTDGDETNHLPFELAELLAKQDTNLLYKNLYWVTKKEDFFDAEKLFKIMLGSFTYSEINEEALAQTAIDHGSFTLLKKQSHENEGAKRSLESIEEYLGEINYQPENEGNSSDYSPPIIDYSTVKPDAVLIHLDTNFENKWQLMDYLKGWTNYWLTKHDKKEIYELNKKFLEKYGMKHISGEHLDVLFPLAQEFDNGQSLEMLINAQINDHGWQKYWTDKKKAEKRWDIVKTYFPQRYLEFFQKSIGGVPLSRGVEYLTLFKDLENAENITEAGVIFAENLMADLKFPLVDWQNDKNNLDLIDLLLQRLLWPSTIVQERTATTISKLLIDSIQKEVILNRLLSWISDQKMESAVAIGLLPILRTLYLSKDRNETSHIKFETIVESIRINSVVIEKLVEELAELLKIEGPNPSLPNYISLDSLPANYEVSLFFSRHIQTYLAPIYMDRARKIQRRTGRPFVKLWALTADKIVENTGTILDSNQVYYYGRTQHDEFLLGFSSKVSQVYRSAFLRVLQMFYSVGYIPEDFYLEWAYATLPIELSHWKIFPNRSPDWWPELNEEHATGKTESFTSLIYTKSVESILSVSEKEYILTAEGAIKPGSDWQKLTPMHSFSLVGFGYKVLGPNIPTPEEVAKEVLYAKTIALPPRTDKPFHFLENQKDFIPIGDEYVQVKDLIIYPLTTREFDLCIGLWQYFRDFEVSINLAPEITSSLTLKTDQKSWFYENNNGDKLFIYKDWLEGLRERYDRKLPLHHGQFITADKSYLDQWLKQNDLRLGYVLKNKYGVKKYSYDEAQVYEEIKLLNVSNIII